MARGRFQPAEFERKWQEWWDKQGIYYASDDDSREKYYNLVMFPYPSGDLHIGHWYNYTGADIYGRYMRMRGYNVSQPIGFDAFGLPAENAAIKRNIQPREWTLDNIGKMQAQMRLMGAGWDWPREVVTCLPDYYRWTQWLFLQFYKQAWPTGPRRPPTGARTATRRWPTSRWSTGAASAAARWSSGARSTSGCCASPSMPTSCCASMGWTGRRRRG